MSQGVSNAHNTDVANDVWVYRSIALFLGLISLAVAVGITILGVNHDEVPPALAALGSSALTALGLMARIGPSRGG